MYRKRGVLKKYTGLFGQRKLFLATTTLMGTIIGAGVLGIPYVVAKAGFLYGLGILVFLGLCLLMMNLFAGELVLRSKEQHQLPGYAEKYLGPTGKKLMISTLLFSIYGALVAYLIGEGETWRAIVGFGSPLLYSLIFFVLTYIIVQRGIQATGRAEFILIVLLVAIIVVIGIFSLRTINGGYLNSTFHPEYFFLPYGVLVFAYMALPAIPELQEVLGKDKRLLKKSIIIGSLLPIVLYLIFTVIVVGVVGVDNFELLQPNERIATIALSMYSLPILGMLANIIAVLAMFTSFLTLATALVEIYHFDYGLPRNFSLALTFSVPLIIRVLNLSSFIAVLTIIGAVVGGLEGILVMLMYWKAKKKGNRIPEYSLGNHYFLGSVLLILFVFGMMYQLWLLLG